MNATSGRNETVKLMQGGVVGVERGTGVDIEALLTVVATAALRGTAVVHDEVEVRLNRVSED